MAERKRPGLSPVSHGTPFVRALVDRLGPGQAAAVARTIAGRVGELPVEEIGHGGHGVVYRLPSGRALKLTSDWTEMDALQVLRDVSHPNLVRVHDVFAVRLDGSALGVVVRDTVETTLDRHDPAASELLDDAADQAEDVFRRDLRASGNRRAALRKAMLWLAGRLFDLGDPLLFDVAEGVSRLAAAGLYGVNFHGRNVGVNALREGPRAVIFDVGRFAPKDVPFEFVEGLSGTGLGSEYVVRGYAIDPRGTVDIVDVVEAGTPDEASRRFREFWGDVQVQDVRERRPKDRPSVLNGPLPKKDTLAVFKDLDRVGRPGEIVVATVSEWELGRPVLEGWRGPSFQSEDFARSRLEAIECGGLLVDLGGFWECLPPGIQVIY